MPLVLVVDDDPRIRRLLHAVLVTRGFHVETAEDGEGVLDLVRIRRPDAVVLDLKMPRVSGLDVLRALRGAGEQLPVLVLTGMTEEDYVLDAFEAGADDYVTKPFHTRILVARLRAVLRRRQPISAPDSRAPAAHVGDVSLDPRTHHVQIGEEQIALSPTEYQLLRVLMRGVGSVFTTDDLLARVWGPAYVGQDDIVRANIYRLRQKLEPHPRQPRYILGRRGVGYFFAAD